MPKALRRLLKSLHVLTPSYTLENKNMKMIVLITVSDTNYEDRPNHLKRQWVSLSTLARRLDRSWP